MSAWTCRHTDGKAAQKIVPPRLRIPYWKGLGADSEEKHEPVGDTNTAKMNSLKVLDPKRPIRKADVIEAGGLHVILTEFHESARIDRQLFGRCARQGNPGSIEAIVSLEDELFLRFVGPRLGAVAEFLLRQRRDQGQKSTHV